MDKAWKGVRRFYRFDCGFIIVRKMLDKAMMHLFIVSTTFYMESIYGHVLAF